MKIQLIQVIQTALDLLDEVGLENLTMRKLAEKLNIQAATLYWHFKNKQQLIDYMADALIENVAKEKVFETTEWPKKIHMIASELRSAFNSRRDGALVYAGTYVATHNTFRVMEEMLKSFMDANLTSQEAYDTSFSLFYYILGFVIEEQALLRMENDKSGNRISLINLMQKNINKYPHVQKIIDNLQSLDFDKKFIFGINLICIGVQGIIKK